MRQLAGKVAVVTGGARGIGRALASALAAEGAAVMIADRDGEAAAEAAASIASAQPGAKTGHAAVDVAVFEQVEALARATVLAFGKVHLVFNNAGVSGRSAPSWKQSPEDWADVLGPNLWGVIHGIRAFVPILLAQGEWGHVVNTASMAGLVSLPSLGPYHVSKHGVVTLSEVLFHELKGTGADVGVSVLCPGFVKTDIARSAKRQAERRGQASPEDGPMQQLFAQLVNAGIPPEEVARATLLAVKENRFYVLTHPAMKKAIRSRMEEILEEKPPTFRLGLGPCPSLPDGSGWRVRRRWRTKRPLLSSTMGKHTVPSSRGQR